MYVLLSPLTPSSVSYITFSYLFFLVFLSCNTELEHNKRKVVYIQAK
jgi:hypothetical protein